MCHFILIFLCRNLEWLDGWRALSSPVLWSSFLVWTFWNKVLLQIEKYNTQDFNFNIGQWYLWGEWKKTPIKFINCMIREMGWWSKMTEPVFYLYIYKAHYVVCLSVCVMFIQIHSFGSTFSIFWQWVAFDEGQVIGGWGVGSEPQGQSPGGGGASWDTRLALQDRGIIQLGQIFASG